MQILDDFLESIANAIRKRKQTTSLINATDFASEIESIPQTSTSVLQNKSVTITNNGTTTVSPDAEYDGLSSVSVTTNVKPSLQSKSATLTSTSALTVKPDSSYYGLSQVTVTPSVQSKSTTITSNGTTTIKPNSGKVGLSSVSVTTNVPRGARNVIQICNLQQSYISGGDSSGTLTIPAGYKYAQVLLTFTTQGSWSGTVSAGSNCSVGTASVKYALSTNYSGTFDVTMQTIAYPITVTNTGSSATVKVTLKGQEARQATVVGIY
jgi:hypothetical protein